jgi:hypothetical protein
MIKEENGSGTAIMSSASVFVLYNFDKRLNTILLEMNASATSIMFNSESSYKASKSSSLFYQTLSCNDFKKNHFYR